LGSLRTGIGRTTGSGIGGPASARLCGFSEKKFHHSEARSTVYVVSVASEELHHGSRQLFELRPADNIPDQIEIDGEVVMNETVAHSTDLPPGHFGAKTLDLIAQRLDSLADDLEIADHGILDDR
jgi:hypothetical protein